MGAIGAVGFICVLCASCGRRPLPARAAASESPDVGVVKAEIRPLSEQLTVSSELVPFQEVEIYAKEPGYVRQLLVDYGSHVRKGQLMAVLEVPELEAQIQQRQAQITEQQDEVKRAAHEVDRVKAQYQVAHLRYERLAGVAKEKSGLVAQQEVDDAQGVALSAESQLEAAQGSYQAAVSQLEVAKAQLAQAQALYSYSRITAPFDGVVTQRYANLGALMQAGTSSNQATPLVRLSQENLFRLVIPVPERYVRFVRTGDPVEVRVPALGRSFVGKVARFSVDVTANTRTMHTEVDIPNPRNELLPGVYAEAVLTLREKPAALTVPIGAVTAQGNEGTVFRIGAGQRLEKTPVTLGMQTPDFVEIATGLSPGDEVVVSDRTALRAGETVRARPVQTVSWRGNGKATSSDERAGEGSSSNE